MVTPEKGILAPDESAQLVTEREAEAMAPQPQVPRCVVGLV